MKPRIFVYNIMSLDGQIGWVKNDFTSMMEYYKLAFRWKVDAVLMGSNSIYELGEHEDISSVAVLPKPEVMPIPEELKSLVYSPKPMLIVTDSSGRLANWTLMQQQPWFGDIVVLCSESTSKKYLEYLEKKGINYLIAGENKVDFNKALTILSEKYGISSIRTDCGGNLTGHLLSGNFIDEIKILVAPLIIGGKAIPNLTEGYQKGEPVRLKLKETEYINEEYVLFTYDVIGQMKGIGS